MGQKFAICLSEILQYFDRFVHLILFTQNKQLKSNNFSDHAQQFTGMFLSLSTSKPKAVQAKVNARVTASITYPLQVMRSIIVRICIQLYMKIQKKWNNNSPFEWDFCSSISPQLLLSWLSSINKLLFLRLENSFLMIFPLIAGRITDSMLIKMVTAKPRMSHPTQSSSAVNLHNLTLTLQRQMICSRSIQHSCAQFQITLGSPQIINITMIKQEPKGIILKTQIKKERVSHYPYHLVTTTYAPDQEYFFLVAVDYALESTVLAIYPFSSDMTKLNMCGITVSNIFSKKAICAVHVISLKYKPTSSGVAILQAEFVLGCRSGQLALIECNGKDCKIVARLNKTIKSQGFLSKTSTFFFGDDDSYSPFIKESLKGFKAAPYPSELQYCYQVGNNLVLLKNLNEGAQKSIFECFEANNAEAFAFHYDLNVPAEKGSYFMFGCQSYYGIKDKNKKIGLIKFNNEVSSFEFLSEKRNELAVSLSTKQTILIIDLNRFILKEKITTQMSLRYLYFFTYKQQEFLTIMFYDNYIVLYQLNSHRFIKLKGHRSFIANVGFHRRQEMLVTGGMDHRISLVKLPSIKENQWSKALIDGKTIDLDEGSCQEIRFSDIFSLGQYNNVRTNLHSYGFADFLLLNNHYCLPTYDAKIMVYKYA